VRPGYKQTEVGVIPDEWGFGEIADLNPFVTSGSRGWANYYSDRGSAFLRITNMSRDSIYLDLTDLKLVKLPPDDKEGTRTQLQNGDLLVSITADIGIIGFIDDSIPKPAYINQHIALVRFDPAKTNSKFLSYFLAGENSQRLFFASTDQGAKAGMNLAGVRKIKAAFPPTSEQRAIAAALSDVDALLAKLDQLIAKKRDLKQAAMQQLLTGQTRLPGFSGEWEVKQFGEVLSRVNGKAYQIQSSDYQDTGDHPVVDQGKEPVIGFSDRADKVFHCPSGGVIVFGDHTCIVKFVDFDFVVGADGTQILAGKNGQSARFQAYQLEYSGIPTTGYNRHFKFVKERVFVTPTLDEQTAIATVLSDMDAELAALETRRDKTRDLKQGMMQELLTGRIRLV